MFNPAQIWNFLEIFASRLVLKQYDFCANWFTVWSKWIGQKLIATAAAVVDVARDWRSTITTVHWLAFFFLLLLLAEILAQNYLYMNSIIQM